MMASSTSPDEASARRVRTAPLVPAPRRESNAAQIRKSLRAEILGMIRRPGDPIAEKQIAAAHGVSRTPVREALLALSEEGLVDIFPQSGTFVARIPLAGMPEAMLVRESLEAAIVRLATAAAGPADIAALEDHLSRQEHAARAGDLSAFYGLDESFHALVARIAGYPGVWSLVQQVKYQIDRFRRLTLAMAGRPGGIVIEHTAIVQAMAARDPERAAAAMAAHLDTVRTGLAAARELNPGYFAEEAIVPGSEGKGGAD